MSSYHTSFTYKEKNSFDEGYIIVAFEPDNGFKATSLSMENISDAYYDGSKRFDYGSKYNSQAEVQIAIIKKDGTDMTITDFRNCAKWLIGSRTNSWLDMCSEETRKKYIGDGETKEFSILDSNNNPLSGNIIAYINNTRVQEFSYNYRTGILEFDTAPKKWAQIEIEIFHPIYSFLGKFTNLEQYKMDARTVGIRLTFSSLSPWAYSQPQTFECDIGQELFVDAGGTLTKDKLETIEDETPFMVDSSGRLYLKNDADADGVFSIESEIAVCDVSNSLFADVDGNLIKNKIESISSSIRFGIDENGVLFPNHLDENSRFDILTEIEDTDQYIIGIDTSYKTVVNNESDDLYTYINLDIDFEAHGKCDNLSIYNKTLNEETVVKNIKAKENISISANQFIISDSSAHKIFGDDFNFVWPRLQPGENNLIIGGGGTGVAYFTYRYPMKIGDCVMDIDVNSSGILCYS